MRNNPTPAMERWRIVNGNAYATDPNSGIHGAYLVRNPFAPIVGNDLRIIAANAEDEEAQGWEHVSVSLHYRTPTCLARKTA